MSYLLDSDDCLKIIDTFEYKIGKNIAENIKFQLITRAARDTRFLKGKFLKGKWITTRTLQHDGELYCNKCGQEHPNQKIIWNYCPNCGAEMEVGEK